MLADTPISHVRNFIDASIFRSLKTNSDRPRVWQQKTSSRNQVVENNLEHLQCPDAHMHTRFFF